MRTTWFSSVVTIAPGRAWLRASALASGRSPATARGRRRHGVERDLPGVEGGDQRLGQPSPASAPRRSRSASRTARGRLAASPSTEQPLHRRAVDLARGRSLVAAQQRVAEAPQHEQVEVLLARDPVVARRVVDEGVDALDHGGRGSTPAIASPT